MFKPSNQDHPEKTKAGSLRRHVPQGRNAACKCIVGNPIPLKENASSSLAADTLCDMGCSQGPVTGRKLLPAPFLPSTCGSTAPSFRQPGYREFPALGFASRLCSRFAFLEDERRQASGCHESHTGGTSKFVGFRRKRTLVAAPFRTPSEHQMPQHFDPLY